LGDVADISAIIAADGFDRHGCEFDAGDLPLFDKSFDIRIADLFCHGCAFVAYHSAKSFSIADKGFEDQDDDYRKERKGKQRIVVEKIIILVVLVIVHRYPFCKSV